MTRVARGDADAFSLLYDQTSSMVYGLALRVVRSEALAEEVTQEVYLQVWRQASGFDAQRGSVRSWMATMAHRRAVDVVRRSQSARDRELKVPADPPTSDVAEFAILGEERDRVRAALNSLTDLQFQVIEMAYYGGLTYSEVAERLDTPLATVKTRIRDGLTRLRAALGDDMDDMHDLTAAYAVDALDDSELEAYEAHLAGCADCREELAGLRESTVSLAAAAGVSPPPSLKERIMAEVHGQETANVVSIDNGRSPRRSWVPLAVAAAVALVLGAVAIFQTMAMNELSGPDGVIAAAQAAAEEPGAIVAELTTDSGAVGQVVLTEDGEGFLVPSDLEPLTEDRTYQLWVITPDELAISAGVLGSEPVASRFTWTDDVAGFALTREVAGGVVSSAGDVVSVVEL